MRIRRLKEGMVLAIEPMVNAGAAGYAGFVRQVDGGDQGSFAYRRILSIAWR